MPDHSWTCNHCGENNPPYTEACRNCYELAPQQAQKSPDVRAVSPLPIPEGATFLEFVAPGRVPYFISLWLLALGCVITSLKVLLLAQHLGINSFWEPLLMLICIWEIRRYFRNETVHLKYQSLPSTQVDPSADNRGMRGLTAFFYLIFYLLCLWLSWR